MAVDMFRIGGLRTYAPPLEPQTEQAKLARDPASRQSRPAPETAMVIELLQALIGNKGVNALREVLDGREDNPLKLQMIMERLTRADTANSHILRKLGDVMSQITGNVK